MITDCVGLVAHELYEAKDGPAPWVLGAGAVQDRKLLMKVVWKARKGSSDGSRLLGPRLYCSCYACYNDTCIPFFLILCTWRAGPWSRTDFYSC